MTMETMQKMSEQRGALEQTEAQIIQHPPTPENGETVGEIGQELLLEILRDAIAYNELKLSWCKTGITGSGDTEMYRQRVAELHGVLELVAELHGVLELVEECGDE